jgi:outer membrane protein TolC
MTRIYYSISTLLIFLSIACFSPAIAQENKSEEAHQKMLSLGLSEYVRMVDQKNENITAQHHEFMISRENVTREKSVFEPELVNSYRHGQDKIRYSQEEQASLLFNTQKDRLFDNVGLVLQSKIPTGADIKFGYTEDVSKDRELDKDWEYKSFYGLEITQPLMSNSGMASTAGIRTAEKDSDISFQTYRIKKIEVIFNAVTACWDFFSAGQKLKIRQDSVKIAQKVLDDNRERYNLGKVAKTEVLEAEAGLAKRKSWELSSRQEMVSAANAVRSYISSVDMDVDLDIDVEKELESSPIKPDFSASMETAFGLRPEYLAAASKIEKEKIQLRYAKNQRWPKLDLNASYGINGLGDALSQSREDAFDQNYNTWHVGLTMTIPLMGNLKSGSELKAAKHRKKQALLELQAVETQIANIIATAVENVYSTRSQATYYTNAREIEQGLLEVELEKLSSGKSNSRSVLEKEEDLNYAKEAELDSIINHQKAIIGLYVAEGSLLQRYGIDEETRVAGISEDGR